MPQKRTASNRPLTVALDYLSRDWSVIPLHSIRDGKCTCAKNNCTHPGKHPLQSWRQYQSRYPTESEVRGWWKDSPDANVGIVTGSISGLVVVDVDPRNKGEDTLRSLLDKYGDLPATVMSRTGADGRHIFFAHPGEGVKIASKASALGSGLDLKADGGYVVAPPSLHSSGNWYHWASGRAPGDVHVAPLPAWLLSHLAVVPEHGERFTLPPVIERGDRNTTLYRYGRQLKSRGLSRKEICSKLMSANRRLCKLPLPKHELQGIVDKVITQPDRDDFRQEQQARSERSPNGAVPEFPDIMTSNRQLRDITDDAQQALRRTNDPPTLFVRGGLLTRVRVDENGIPLLEPLSGDVLRGLLTRAANWWTQTRQGPRACSPPADVVHDMLTLGHWSDIPPLTRLVEAPTFANDGTLLTADGYNPAGRLWFHRAQGFTIPAVSPNPTARAVSEARDQLLVELLGDFPFVDDASRAHTLAALLLPFLRDLIDGPTPLHLIDAPTPGTGKSLLAEAITIPAVGRSATVMAEGQDDEEWRKRITAILLDGPVFVLIDNIRRRLDSSSLSSALTATSWKDRILGKSATATLPVRAIWLATGNNVALSNEIARRSVWIRLDAKVDRPWARSDSDFQHPNLRTWALESRARLVHAALTLIQAWIVAGRPKGKETLGSFGVWAETIGGILGVAGVPGFLGNAKALYSQADDELQPWREFVVAWWREYKRKRVGTEDLFALAVEEGDTLVDVLGDGFAHSQRTRFGQALSKMRDRVVGGFRITDEGEDHRGRRLYRLQPVEQLNEDSADVKPTSGRRSRPTSARKTAEIMLD